MLILAVIVVCLTLGNCTLTLRRESTDKVNFRVEVLRNKDDLTVTPEMETFHYEGTINYDEGDTIELTCKQNVETILKWQEHYTSVATGSRQKKDTALRLTIKPDKDDNMLKLICKDFGPYLQGDRVDKWNISSNYEDKKISILLLLSSKSRMRTDTILTDHQYVKKREDLRSNATCTFTDIVRFGPNTRNNHLASFSSNHTIIDKFEERDNGTIVSCVSYINVTGPSDEIQSYERQKTTTIYYLEPESPSTWNELTEIRTEKRTETAGRKETENWTGANRTATSEKGPPNKAAIMSGVLGSIIFILITAVIVMWFRKKHRSSPDDQVADRVMYAEIEERLPQRPPPQRDETPYAKIIGSLVPKQQQPCVVEPLYCEIAA